MNTAIEQTSNGSEHLTAPYGDLHIYYLRGRLESDFHVPGNGFIGNWEEDGFSFLFFTRPAGNEVEGILRGRRNLELLDTYHMTYEEWLGKKPSPFSVGRFNISPPWEASGKGSEILLDPGVVFGDGTHPTTRDCLEIIDGLDGVDTALDLGTGTGLLSLAAVAAGCRKVLAVDFNFLAAKTAGKNIALNGMGDKIISVRGRAEDFIDFPADLIIANIHYDVMKDLVGSNGFLSKKMFVLSGLLRSQAREIAAKLSKLPVIVEKQIERDGVWHTFFGRVC